MEKKESTGTHGLFLDFFKLNDFQDDMSVLEKQACYANIQREFPVDLSLMTNFPIVDAKQLDGVLFWDFLAKNEEEFCLTFESKKFFIFINTFPKKILVRATPKELCRILTFDDCGFEFFICDSDYTSCIMEGAHGILIANNEMLCFFRVIMI